MRALLRVLRPKPLGKQKAPKELLEAMNAIPETRDDLADLSATSSNITEASVYIVETSPGIIDFA